MKAVGARLPRYDGVGHVTGRTQYVDDVRVGKHLWVKALRSPHHHAAITALDTSKAEQMKGVHAVITGGNVTQHPFGYGFDNTPLKVDKVRCVGDPIAVVVAESRYIAEDGCDVIEVDYEPLGPVTSVAAIAPSWR